jgi:hypothetical protein
MIPASFPKADPVDGAGMSDGVCPDVRPARRSTPKLGFEATDHPTIIGAAANA